MNELKLIKVSELEVGDEIIISSYSNLKYLKVLKLPKLKTNNWGDYYTSVNVFETDASKHNSIIYQNLNNRHILLVKRENN